MFSWETYEFSETGRDYGRDTSVLTLLSGVTNLSTSYEQLKFINKQNLSIKICRFIQSKFINVCFISKILICVT